MRLCLCNYLKEQKSVEGMGKTRRLVLGCNKESCCSSLCRLMSEKKMVREGFGRRSVDRVLFFDEMQEATP